MYSQSYESTVFLVLLLLTAASGNGYCGFGDVIPDQPFMEDALISKPSRVRGGDQLFFSALPPLLMQVLLKKHALSFGTDDQAVPPDNEIEIPEPESNEVPDDDTPVGFQTGQPYVRDDDATRTIMEKQEQERAFLEALADHPLAGHPLAGHHSSPGRDGSLLRVGDGLATSPGSGSFFDDDLKGAMVEREKEAAGNGNRVTDEGFQDDVPGYTGFVIESGTQGQENPVPRMPEDIDNINTDSRYNDQALLLNQSGMDYVYVDADGNQHCTTTVEESAGASGEDALGDGQCPVCLRLCNSAVSFCRDSRHSCCNGCAQEMLKHKFKNCPKCRMATGILHRSSALQDRINLIKVYCPYQGCSETPTVGAFPDHLLTCRHRPRTVQAQQQYDEKNERYLKEQVKRRKSRLVSFILQDYLSQLPKEQQSAISGKLLTASADIHQAVLALKDRDNPLLDLLTAIADAGQTEVLDKIRNYHLLMADHDKEKFDLVLTVAGTGNLGDYENMLETLAGAVDNAFILLPPSFEPVDEASANLIDLMHRLTAFLKNGTEIIGRLMYAGIIKIQTGHEVVQVLEKRNKGSGYSIDNTIHLIKVRDLAIKQLERNPGKWRSVPDACDLLPMGREIERVMASGSTVSDKCYQIFKMFLYFKIDASKVAYKFRGEKVLDDHDMDVLDGSGGQAGSSLEGMEASTCASDSNSDQLEIIKDLVIERLHEDPERLPCLQGALVDLGLGSHVNDYFQQVLASDISVNDKCEQAFETLKTLQTNAQTVAARLVSDKILQARHLDVFHDAGGQLTFIIGKIIREIAEYLNNIKGTEQRNRTIAEIVSTLCDNIRCVDILAEYPVLNQVYHDY